MGANGFPRATNDVDFLVGDEAFEHHANELVTLRASVPFQVRGIAIEIVMPRPGEATLADALDGESGSPLDAPRLVYMKLRAPRHKDRTDVIELIKSGIEVDACRSLLSTNTPDLLPDLESAVRRARSEE